jgi:RNA polymerase sigma factor for flagellar operon FliA
MELDDLTHAGVMGLFDAASKYRADREVTFRNYAKYRIKGAILDSLRQLDWASRDLRRRQKQVEAVTQELTESLERDPTEAEIATRMGLPSRRWRALMVDFRSIGLAAAQLRSGKGKESAVVPETEGSPDSRPDRLLARSEMRKKIDSAIKTLPRRHQQVVRLYYGRELTMKEIGGIMGVNESRVSQIHKSALEKMQNILGANGIQSAAFLV